MNYISLLGKNETNPTVFGEADTVVEALTLMMNKAKQLEDEGFILTNMELIGTAGHLHFEPELDLILCQGFATDISKI